MVGFLTILSFAICILMAVNSPGLPVAALNIKVEGKFEMTSISVAAILMILYNLFTWVQMVQKMRNSKEIGDFP